MEMLYVNHTTMGVSTTTGKYFTSWSNISYFQLLYSWGFVGTQYYIILPLLVNSDSLNNNISDYEWHRIIPHPILQVAPDNYKFSICHDN
jgi:hypothetical protein